MEEGKSFYSKESGKKGYSKPQEVDFPLVLLQDGPDPLGRWNSFSHVWEI
jgi:hypothetical protein